MLAFLRARAIPGVETVDRDRYARTIAFRGHHGVLAVMPSARHRLAVTVAFPQLGALPDIIARVRRVFDLAADPEPINAHLAGDPLLAPLVAARPGLRVPGAWDGFELAVRAIVGQQITVPAATRLLGRLALSYGEALGEAAPAAGLTHVFPTPERLAASDPGLLAMPGQRARALASLAASVVADPTMLGPRRSLEDAIAALTALPGIGEWTAQYIAMRELREPDAFPAADIGLMRAMTGPDGRRPTPAELTRHAERWRPWRAYAALHLWASGQQQATSSPENVRDQKAA
jgi:AraC family transcriptional regulator of adaptative response / DNA-3-methyladenine glycosylase II